MWQRFTERARRVVFVAQEEAIRLGDNLISTEHLLLGLLQDKDNLANAVLYRIGISRKRIRTEIAGQIGSKETWSSQNMQFAPLGKQVLEFAYDEARLLGNNYIGTEHILLALIREPEGWAGRLLISLGADLGNAREETKRLQATEADSPRLDQSDGALRVGTHPNLSDWVVPDGSFGKPDFDALYTKYERRIFDVLYRHVGDHEVASDLTQETFIWAHRYYPYFRGDKQVYTWLYQIARNLVNTHKRQQGR